MEVFRPDIEGLVVIQPKIFGDSRGCFLETYNQKKYREIGIDEDFVQDNQSVSEKGVLRGLHFQNPKGQGKLVSVVEGEVYDVAVDVRKDSATFGKHFGLVLTAEKKNQFYIPPGFAHGFCVLSERAIFTYKCTEFYHPEHEHSLLWSDPDLGIEWPVENPEVSEKDLKGLRLNEFEKRFLPE